MGQKKNKETGKQAARKYAESLVCPVCGNPIRVRQKICHYCKSNIREESWFIREKGNRKKYG